MKKWWYLVIAIIVAAVIAAAAWNKNDKGTNSQANQQTSAACPNNPAYSCPSINGGIDFYPSPGENARNPQYKPGSNDVERQIIGKISKFNGKEVDLSVSNGTSFKVFFPNAGVDWWNHNRSQNYNGFKVGVGDPLMVMYSEDSAQHSTTIQPNQVVLSEVLVQVSKSSSTVGHLTDFSFR